MAQDINPNMRLRVDVLSPVLEVAHRFIIQLFQETALLDLHRKHVTAELPEKKLIFHLIDRHIFLWT